jgi:HlyD family secretion protein
VRNVEALVKQRESQLAQARVDLDRTTIRAPMDGIVVKKSVEPGQTVAASLQAPELFIIAQDLRNMRVDVSIDEAEVGRVREGQPVTFTVDSFPGRVFRGTVGQVRKAAQVVQNVVTYTAVIATSNPNLELFPGMTANVRIVTATREAVLKVPNAALRFRPAGAAETRAAGGEGDTAGAQASGDEEKGGRGGQSGDAMRNRLAAELSLSAEQQARLDEILRETREGVRAIPTEDKAERRRHAERLRAEARLRIAEMLDPQQRKRYEEMTESRGSGGGRAAASGRVWVVDDTGKPTGVDVRLGLSDGTHTEVLGGAVQEGTQVVIGTQADKTARAQPKGGPRFGVGF